MSTKVAYFSAEFGIDESLPIYSGGLGILAGDHIKAANNLSLPLAGVGIFYSKGFFQQQIREDGVQQHLYPQTETEKISIDIEQVFDYENHPLIIEVQIANRLVYLKVWRVQVGCIPVYLLNSDIEQNNNYDRHLTDVLYEGDKEIRICQEIILGIGGVRLFHALGIHPEVWHMNEGHSAFLALERIREFSAMGVPFDTALEAVKASTVFTTHTPVAAGHDVFSMEMMDRYFGDFYWQLGADREKILALGRMGDGFNLTRLAVNMSSKVNGVSKLHTEVTKDLFHRWTPHIPSYDISVESITNGIHIGTWLSPEMKELFDRYLPLNWEDNVADPDTWAIFREIPDPIIWETHLRAKGKLIQQLGIPAQKETLIIGFARRFATYKRALLIFQDLDRLSRIVNDPNHPVCFVFAGKAHPSDGPGQELIRRIVVISKMERFKDKICFVENYDIKSAKWLVQGVDVWLNTPEKPMEASGTSGQKAALNGVLNCSVLDGWWNEGFNGRNGWAIDGAMEGLSEYRDRLDSDALYHILEKEIVPLHFERDEQSVPTGWVKVMKESICTLAPKFNTIRMVNEYWNQLYAPTAARGSIFSANGFGVARKVAAYKRFIYENWNQVQVQNIHIVSSQGTRIGLTQTLFHVKIHLGPIPEKDVRVETVGSDGKGNIWKVGLVLVKQLEKGLYLYEGAILDTIDALWHSNANVRVTPVSPDFCNDFEMELAAWGKR